MGGRPRLRQRLGRMADRLLYKVSGDLVGRTGLVAEGRYLGRTRNAHRV
jgi:hypothetical protein